MLCVSIEKIKERVSTDEPVVNLFVQLLYNPISKSLFLFHSYKLPVRLMEYDSFNIFSLFHITSIGKLKSKFIWKIRFSRVTHRYDWRWFVHKFTLATCLAIGKGVWQVQHESLSRSKSRRPLIRVPSREMRRWRWCPTISRQIQVRLDCRSRRPCWFPSSKLSSTNVKAFVSRYYIIQCWCCRKSELLTGKCKWDVSFSSLSLGHLLLE
jgi:hypothetical protein